MPVSANRHHQRRNDRAISKLHTLKVLGDWVQASCVELAPVSEEFAIKARIDEYGEGNLPAGQAEIKDRLSSVVQPPVHGRRQATCSGTPILTR
jgi:hypothetical protein